MDQLSFGDKELWLFRAYIERDENTRPRRILVTFSTFVISARKNLFPRNDFDT